MKYAVMNWIIRPDLVATSRETIKTLIEHTAYMRDLQKKGRVLMAGGFLDGTGGMDIMEVDSLEEALDISKNDPLARANLIRQDIKAWSTDLDARHKMFSEMYERAK